jgi:multiple sugar transport system permease protein
VATRAEPIARRRPSAASSWLDRHIKWLLVTPAAAIVVVLTIFPLGFAVWVAFVQYDFTLGPEHPWVGLDNFVENWRDPVWKASLWRTVWFSVTMVAIELVLGMLLALVMHRAIFGRGLVRTAALVPYGIITVVAAFAWRFAWSTAEGGFVPKLLGWSFDPTATTEPFWNYVVVILTEVWKTTPFMALLLLAGLTLVPQELHEAAKVDGATAWQRFWRITIPLMKPAILVAVLFRTLDAFRIFDSVYILSAGNNPNLETVSVLDYNELLTRLNLGVGSAISVLIFLCVVLIAFLFVKGLGTSLAQQRGED